MICQRFGARYGLAVGAVATLGAAAYGLVVVRRDAEVAVTDAARTEAIADASSDLGEGPVVATPAVPQPTAG